MPMIRVNLAQLPWTAGAHPLEQKKASAEAPLALLEFAPGFVDPNVCERSHVFYVLEGALTLELDDARHTLTAGEACTLSKGTRHRARNDGDSPVRLFVASEVLG